MQLESGKLYETKQGKRYRVTGIDTYGNPTYTCDSFGGFWYADGFAKGKVGMDGKRKRPHLIKEVDESRWVPIPRDYYISESTKIRTNGRHVQMQVSRETAKQIVAKPSYAISKKEEPDFLNLPDCGIVERSYRQRANVWFNWTFVREDNIITYLDIETSSGVDIMIPM